ncbi:hypothetical protein BMETH_733_2 [methanotrophic bacterial endosymbiont of Bathymodiolus sp.]|jgi:hypothetical protein|nr:hypothetical protein BMETH_733_2 [methanotrophic bacterial endosymbiont of Bathymodiolus sp.]
MNQPSVALRIIILLPSIYLDRQLTTPKPDRFYVGVITYVHTQKG